MIGVDTNNNTVGLTCWSAKRRSSLVLPDEFCGSPKLNSRKMGLV
jgi:hypothetical protein